MYLLVVVSDLKTIHGYTAIQLFAILRALASQQENDEGARTSGCPDHSLGMRPGDSRHADGGHGREVLHCE